MDRHRRLFLSLTLLLFVYSTCQAAQPVLGNPEVMGHIKPPDDEVLGKHERRAVRIDGVSLQDGVQTPLERPRVPVSTVALLTFLMAAISGLGTVPFFFFELDDRWKGSCNGIACGVMIAASFDLISEGQAHGDGTCVMIGIILGGVFIIVSQKILEGFGDIKMVDLSNASARRMIVIVAIMTLHSFGEGSGVGVSFAGPTGFAQGLLVTIAIAIHNIPEGMAVSMVLVGQGVKPFKAMLWSIFTSLPQFLVAVPAFMFAGVFHQFLPLCTGFAAGCMIWIVFGEVMPEALEEGAKGSEIATAATVSIAIMEWLATSLAGLHEPPQWASVAPFFLSMLFILGPLFGGAFLVALKAALPLHSALLAGLAGGIIGTLSLWQPLQFIASGKLPFIPLAGSFFGGVLLYAFLSHKFQVQKRHLKEHGVLGNKLSQRRRSILDAVLANMLEPINLGLCPGTRFTTLVTVALCAHSLAEGLMLGVATAPKSAGLGMAMLLPVALHGLPRGIGAAATLLGIGNGSSASALLAATLAGMAGPIGAMLALATGMDYRGLDSWLTLACGFLLPAAALGLLPKAMGLDRRRSMFGALLGVGVVLAGYAATRAVCANTAYCNSAPEALT